MEKSAAENNSGIQVDVKNKRSSYFKQYYEENKDKIAEQRRDRYHNNPDYRNRTRLCNTMSHAKRARTKREKAMASGRLPGKHYDDLGNQLYTISDVSEMVGKAVFTLRKYHEDGILPETIKAPRGWRLYSHDQIKWLQHMLAKCTPEGQDYANLECFRKNIHMVWNTPYVVD